MSYSLTSSLGIAISKHAIYRNWEVLYLSLLVEDRELSRIRNLINNLLTTGILGGYLHREAVQFCTCPLSINPGYARAYQLHTDLFLCSCLEAAASLIRFRPLRSQTL